MSPEQWEQVKAALAAVAELDEPARRAYFSQLDPEVARETLSLLGYADKTSALSRSLLGTGALAPETAAQGQYIGPYRIVAEIAQGGMGAVYRAEGANGDPVAVKILKRGMDSDAILRRFDAERQILATFEHPNFARMLDGGVSGDGLPYFVMELIEGKPLVEYCDALRLPVADRLRLFSTICDAVEHAHSKGVIHRDLKPANILVTADGVPKVLDFGIAKVVHADHEPGTTTVTATMHRVMTPEYASPEQVLGDRSTPASDVYALGVILYELMVGRRPYRVRARTMEQMAEVVCKQEPERPSTAVTRGEDHSPAPESVGAMRGASIGELARTLSRGLDAVILKALRKAPGERYATPRLLKEDVERVLAGERTAAQKDAWRFQAAAALRSQALRYALVVVLMAMVGIAAWRTARPAPAIVGGLPSDARAAKLFQEGVAFRRALDGAAARGSLEQAAAIEPTHALTHAELASAHALLGEDAAAKVEARKALDLAAGLDRENRLLVEARFAEMSGQQQKTIDAYKSLANFFPDKLDYALALADVLTAAGKGSEALDLLKSISALPAAQGDPRVDLAEAAAAGAIGDYKRQQQAAARTAAASSEPLVVARARLLEGKAWDDLSVPLKARDAYLQSRSLYEQHRDRRGIALVHNGLAGVNLHRGEMTAARADYEVALKTSLDAGFRMGAASAYNNLGILTKQQGNFEEAIRFDEQAVAIRREIGDRSGLTNVLNNLANVHLEQGALSKAKPLYAEALGIAREMGDQRVIARVLHNSAVLARFQLDLATARIADAESLEIRRKISPAAAGEALLNVGESNFLEGRLADSRKAYQEAVDIFRKQSSKRALGYALLGLASVARQEGKLDEASALLVESASIRAAMNDKPALALTQLAQAELDLDRGSLPQARELAGGALSSLKALKASQDEAHAWLILGTILDAAGDRPGAEEAHATAARLLGATEYRQERMLLDLLSARILRSKRQYSASLAKSEGLLMEATQLGLVGWQLEVRAELGQTERAAGQTDRGRVRLDLVHRDAREKGYLRLAK